MNINFDSVKLSYENIDGGDERLKRILNLALKLLDEKLSEPSLGDKDVEGDISNSSSLPSSSFSSNIAASISIEKITVPDISVDPQRSDFEIASLCASAIYQAMMAKL
jgi:hypothetical protein